MFTWNVFINTVFTLSNLNPTILLYWITWAQLIFGLYGLEAAAMCRDSRQVYKILTLLAYIYYEA